MNSTKKSDKFAMLKFYLCVSVLAISANLAHPFTPKLLTHLQMPDYMFGVAFACMSATSFFLGPFWGKLSDSMGRMKMQGLSCFGYAVGQLLFCNATTVPTVIVARLFSGLFCASQGVCSMAFVADTQTGSARIKHMSYLAAVLSVSSAFGYAIGGFLGEVSMTLAFYIQAGMLCLSGVLMLLLVKDNYNKDNKRPPLSKILSESNPLKVFLTAKDYINQFATIFLLSVFIASFATFAFDSAFNYYLSDALNFPSTYNGTIKAIVGIISLTANFTVNIWLANHTNQRNSIIVIFFLCFASVASVVFATNSWSFMALSVVALIFNSIYLPMQQSLATQSIANDSNGVAAGLFNSAKSAGMVAGSLFSGFVYTFGNKLPFVFAGLLFATAMILSASLITKKLKALNVDN